MTYKMARDRLAAVLHNRGFHADADDIGTALDYALREYQSFHRLKIDGVAGSITERSLFAHRFCNAPDLMQDANGRCRWGHKNITWGIMGSLSPRLSVDAIRDAYMIAWGYWAEVCDIQPQHSTTRPNVVMGHGTIDGDGNTLAWSELPCGNQQQLQQKYDTGESWVVKERPGRNEIDLVRVAAHEIGHVLGIPHLESGNLLQPTYDPNIRRPQRGDIREAQLRYGVPKDKPTDPVDPPPTDELRIAFTGARVL